MNPMVGVVHWTAWMMARAIKIRPFNEAMLKRGSRNENVQERVLSYYYLLLHYVVIVTILNRLNWLLDNGVRIVCIWSLECWSWVKSGHARDFLINLCAYPKTGLATHKYRFSLNVHKLSLSLSLSFSLSLSLSPSREGRTWTERESTKDNTI